MIGLVILLRKLRYVVPTVRPEERERWQKVVVSRTGVLTGYWWLGSIPRATMCIPVVAWGWRLRFVMACLNLACEFSYKDILAICYKDTAI